MDETSAKLEIPGERIYPLHRTHRQMCVFGSSQEAEYKMVLSEIARVARAALQPARPTGHAHSPAMANATAHQEWTGDDKAVLAHFRAFDISDYRQRLPTPAQGTCQWILKSAKFGSWQAEDHPAVLWVAGHAGSGKTVASSFLAGRLEEAIHHHSNTVATATAGDVFAYFCNDMITHQRNAHGVLAGLIFQLLSSHHSLAGRVRKAYDIHGATLTQSFAALWTLFKEMAGDLVAGSRSVVIVIDALDECEPASRGLLVDAIRNFVVQSQGQQAQDVDDRLQSAVHEASRTPSIKFIITSRQLPEQTTTTAALFPAYALRLDDDGDGHTGDLQLYIHQRVAALAQARHLAPAAVQSLITRLETQAGSTFLWVQTVLNNLEAAQSLTASKMDELVRQIPAELGDVYARLVKAIPQDQVDVAGRLLGLVLGSARPLTLDELNIAFTLDADHVAYQTAEDIASNCQMSLYWTLSNVLGQLVRVSVDGRVSLLHQSVKEFLLVQGPYGGGEGATIPPAIQNLSEESCAMAIAEACMHYLLLNDFGEDRATLPLPAKGDHASFDATALADDDDDGADSFSGMTLGIWDDEDDAAFEDDGTSIRTLFRREDTWDSDMSQPLVAQCPLYEYAALHWAEQLSQCEASASVAVKTAAKRLLDPSTAHCRNWLRFRTAVYYAPGDGQNGMFPDEQDDYDMLSLAAYFNLYGIVLDCLSDEANAAGAGTESSQRRLNNALFWAASQGHTEVAKRLLSAGANPSSPVTSQQVPPFVAAARNGHVACVKLFLDDDRTNLNVQSGSGHSALSVACHRGHREVVETLLHHQFSAPWQLNLDLADKTGSTPLLWASGVDQVEIVKLLLSSSSVSGSGSKQINVNHQDKIGRTPVSWAASEACSATLKVLLATPGINPDQPDRTGRSPLSWAASSGSTATARILLRDSRVDGGKVDNTGRNAISWACGRAQAETLRMLLQHRCPGIDAPDESGWTPLAWATQVDSLRTVELLLEPGTVKLDRRDAGGRTALAWAVSYGYLRMVEALLKAGAKPQVGNDAGETPLSIAEAAGRKEIMETVRANL